MGGTSAACVAANVVQLAPTAHSMKIRFLISKSSYPAAPKLRRTSFGPAFGNFPEPAKRAPRMGGPTLGSSASARLACASRGRASGVDAVVTDGSAAHPDAYASVEHRAPRGLM